jgi:hypothetical protein
MLQRACCFQADFGGTMVDMWLLWLKHRWRGAGALVITVLVGIVIALLALSRSTLSIGQLGDASAARPATGGQSSAVLPRSGVPLVSRLDQAVPASAGPQSVAAAQASWSAAEVARHQAALLAAVNCARGQQGQAAVILDVTLSATAGDAWLKLVRQPSWSLMQLPGRYALRGIVSLDVASPEQVAAQSQSASTGQQTTMSGCTVSGVDGATLAAGADARSIGIAVFPPQASWDAASAVVLVQ